MYKVGSKRFQYNDRSVKISVTYWEDMPRLGEAYEIKVRVSGTNITETRHVPAYRRRRDGWFSTEKVETDLDKEIQIVWEEVKDRLDKIGRRTDKNISINVYPESRHEESCRCEHSEQHDPR